MSTPSQPTTSTEWRILAQDIARLLSMGAQHVAAERLARYIEGHPHEPKALRALGRIRYAQSKPEEAALLFKQAIQELQTLKRRLQGQTTMPERTPSTHSRDRYPGSVESEPFEDEDDDYVQQRAAEAQAARDHFDLYTDDSILTEASPIVPQPEATPETREIPVPAGEAGVSLVTEEGSTKETFADIEDGELTALLCNDAVDGEAAVLVEADAVETLADDVDLDLEPDDATDDHADADVLILESAQQTSTLEEKTVHSIDEYEWDTFDDELLTLDEFPQREDVQYEVQFVGRISKRQRARQVAIALGEQYGWARDGIELLTDVFTAYWWSTAKRSMQRELEAGLQPDELRLALEVREIWVAHPEFVLSFNGYAYWTLSWPVALEVVRGFRGVPEPEEIELTLEYLYDAWRSDHTLRVIYSSFRDYLKGHFQLPFKNEVATPCVTLADGYQTEDDEYYAGTHAGLNTPYYQELVAHDLIPNYWTDPGSRYKLLTEEDLAALESEIRDEVSTAESPDTDAIRDEVRFDDNDASACSTPLEPGWRGNRWVDEQ